MFVLGLTGSIAMGKSTASQSFRCFGVPEVDHLRLSGTVRAMQVQHARLCFGGLMESPPCQVRPVPLLDMRRTHHRQFDLTHHLRPARIQIDEVVTVADDDCQIGLTAADGGLSRMAVSDGHGQRDVDVGLLEPSQGRGDEVVACGR